MIRYSNRCKCLLCYLLAFALPLLWLAAAVWFLYPCRLAGTAPNVAANLLSLCPGLEKLLPSLTQTAQLCAVPEGLGGQAFRVALVARERVWLAFTTGCALLVWGLTLLVQLGWRARFSSAEGAASQTGRAIRSYRLRMILLAGINGLMAALVWLAGVRFIGDRGLWDVLTYFLPYPLHLLAAWLVFRLAAPAAISGRHGFFKRL
mgnify:CR=1 FL=1